MTSHHHSNKTSLSMEPFASEDGPDSIMVQMQNKFAGGANTSMGIAMKAEIEHQLKEVLKKEVPGRHAYARE